MNNKQSDELLQQLHDVIHKIDSVDEKGCELLQDLDGDIRALLERSGEHPANVRASALKRLERSIDYFEVTHPELTELLAKVMSSLSNAGV
jgi:hypothetical protein